MTNGDLHDAPEESPDAEDDETNFKMVIKNGVLMKKQKQRRYRHYRCDLDLSSKIPIFDSTLILQHYD